MRTVAVVGGTGFLGKYVVAALKDSGIDVRILSRRNGFDALRPSPDSLKGVNAVVNLAGIKRPDGSQTFQGVHVDLVHALIRCMKEVGIRRLIHISVVVARPAPDLPYHHTKWQGEEAVRHSGLAYSILRPGVIYGDGDDMLSHLTLMIRTSPIFPIVGRGMSPMRPVDARDVAAAVVAALNMDCFGKTYDVVGPDRLDLREVVRVVADALDLPLWICPTPVSLMRIPVRIMEAFMTQPLSTRAQLAMLAEGLDGDPEPACEDLQVTTAPFTVERIRPLLLKSRRTTPMDLRLFSAPRPRKETSLKSFSLLLTYVLLALTFVFRLTNDRWAGMTIAMAPTLAACLCLSSVRHRMKFSIARITIGIGAGAILYAATRPAAALLLSAKPDWQTAVRELYSWRSVHSALFLGLTLPLIVIAEEALWRGVVTRFLMERLGRMTGIALAAVIYATAHWATFNPVLVLAALGCGLYWGWLYAATNDLVAPTVSHLLWDFVLLFASPLLKTNVS